MAHTPDGLGRLRDPSEAEPLRVLISGCLAGQACGVDGSDYGTGGGLSWLTSLSVVTSFTFCPEDHALGTPRATPDTHGGDGFDVLEGRARILDQDGEDITEAMLAGAEAMRDFAVEKGCELAILMDMSAACGSQVISDGCRLVENRKYRAGVGLATACLLRAGVPVVAQRDRRSLGRLHQKLVPDFKPPGDVLDHHERDWYRSYFKDLR